MFMIYQKIFKRKLKHTTLIQLLFWIKKVYMTLFYSILLGVETITNKAKIKNLMNIDMIYTQRFKTMQNFQKIH